MKSSPDVAAYSWYRFRFPLAPATFLTPCSYVHLYLSDAPMFKVLSLIYILFYLTSVVKRGPQGLDLCSGLYEGNQYVTEWL